PERKEAPHADPRQRTLPIGADVREKQVSEDDGVEPRDPGPERREGGAHVGFVLVVRGARRDQNLLERQAEGLGLPPEQRAANPGSPPRNRLRRRAGKFVTSWYGASNRFSTLPTTARPGAPACGRRRSS